MSESIANIILGYVCYKFFFLQLELEYYLSPVFIFLISCMLFHKYKSDTDSLVKQLTSLFKKHFDSCYLLKNPGWH